MSQTIPNSNPKSTEVSMIRPLLKRYLNLKHLTQHQLRYSISPSKSFIRSKIDDIIQSKLSNFENNPQKICKNRLDLYEETQIIYKNFSLLF